MESRRETAASRLRQAVAERMVRLVLAALERGERPPWRRPWEGGLGDHRSGRSRRPYQNLNAWSTWCTAMAHQYRSNLWYTLPNADSRGWTLKAGSVGAQILVPLVNSSEEQLQFGATAGFAERVVFNLDSFDGAPLGRPVQPWDAASGVARAVRCLEQAGVDLGDRGSAHFDHANDSISLPSADLFESAPAWAATAMHELVHWTGFRARLQRITPPWSMEDYAEEELVAELGAAMLCARLRIPATRTEDEQHVAYLTAWASRLRTHPEMLHTALGKADDAVRFLEEVAPAAFDDEHRTGPDTVRLSDVPRTLREGDTWRGNAKRHLAPPKPDLLLDAGQVEAFETWANAPTRDEHDQRAEPVLWLVGAPGDGAEAAARQVHLDVTKFHQQRSTGSGSPPPSRRLHRAANGDTPLPAYLLFPEEASAGLSELPATTGATVQFLDKPGRRRTRLLIVARPPLPAAARALGVVVDFSLVPVPKTLAGRLLMKSDPRPWIAVAHRNAETVRRLEAWANRLKADWLDGARTRKIRSRIRFVESAPIAPVVLHAAQAVVDSVVRTDQREPPDLHLLVRSAIDSRGSLQPFDLVPLDELMAPWTGVRPVSLEDRVEVVVELLELCPEVARGTLAVALCLVRSTEEDPDALAAEILRTCRHHGRLQYRKRSWSLSRSSR